MCVGDPKKSEIAVSQFAIGGNSNKINRLGGTEVVTLSEIYAVWLGSVITHEQNRFL